MNIITDEQFLRQTSELATLDEAKEISKQLFTVLEERNQKDVGLAAPQIGILKQVCLVRAKQLIVLVNPKIVETAGETWYQEGCVSFPGASVRTKRHKSVVVTCDWYGYSDIHNMDDLSWQNDVKLYFTDNDYFSFDNDPDLLECVAVQHEIDHVRGILFFDREWKNEPIKKEKKQKPNEKCACLSGKKYKKCCGKV